MVELVLRWLAVCINTMVSFNLVQQPHYQPGGRPTPTKCHPIGIATTRNLTLTGTVKT